MHKISENLTVIQNVSSDFFLLFRSNNTNSSNENNLQLSPSNGQQRSKREASQSKIPCQSSFQEITLFKDSYEIISHDGDSLVLSKTPKVLNIICSHQNQQCCHKTTTYCRTFSRNRKFIRVSNNDIIVPGSMTGETLGEYCKCTL